MASEADSALQASLTPYTLTPLLHVCFLFLCGTLKFPFRSFLSLNHLLFLTHIPHTQYPIPQIYPVFVQPHYSLLVSSELYRTGTNHIIKYPALYFPTL